MNERQPPSEVQKSKDPSLSQIEEAPWGDLTHPEKLVKQMQSYKREGVFKDVNTIGAFKSRFFGVIKQFPDSLFVGESNNTKDRDARRQHDLAIGEYFLALLTHQIDLNALLSDESFRTGKAGTSDSMEPRHVLEKVIRDLPRTKAFMNGVRTAVAQKIQEKPGNAPIRVVDAGCGPFPILGLTAALSDPRVTVDCVEINPQSAAIARMFIASLGLQDRVRVHHADATNLESWWSDRDKKADILMSETIDAGGFEEPMMNIFDAINTIADKDAIRIPSMLRFTAYVMSNAAAISNRTPGVVPKYIETLDGSIPLYGSMSGFPSSNTVIVDTSVQSGQHTLSIELGNRSGEYSRSNVIDMLRKGEAVVVIESSLSLPGGALAANQSHVTRRIFAEGRVVNAHTVGDKIRIVESGRNLTGALNLGPGNKGYLSVDMSYVPGGGIPNGHVPVIVRSGHDDIQPGK